MSEGRRLHIDEIDGNGEPLYGFSQQMQWNRARKDYADAHVRPARSDRIPWHDPLFHERGPYRQGPNVPPLLIRRPSNDSLRELLPEWVRNYNPATDRHRIFVPRTQTHEADTAAMGEDPQQPIVQAAVRPFLPPNPLGIGNQQRLLREHFEM